ncbi:MAG TPA: Mur ligase family protein [Parachlamydiaceae bacterium]|nr:Mur ligase family protein [Parachlamydiaceae bacterium]
MTSYETLLHKLFHINMTSSMKLGLKNSEALHQAFDFPSHSFESIHVAGSNGKGSVCIKIAKALELSGLKVGLYTSPHISSFRERIQINGTLISEEDVAKHLEAIFKLRESKNIPVTFFEITTLLALNYFKEQKIDIAVLETGLGGRLDATNIVTPKLSIITSISLDHTDILGHTLEEIAFEKAGIIKSSIPVVIGPKVPAAVVEKVALENKSLCIRVEGFFKSFEEENNAVARRALQQLKIKEPFILEGLKKKQPCRFEIIKKADKTIILDVAHNPDGLTRLFKDIEEKFPAKKMHVILGLSQNKDISECVKVIRDKAEAFHLVVAKNGRGIALAELKKQFKEKQHVFCHKSVDDAINSCLEQQEELLVICGTFFIMDDAKKAVGIQEPSDKIDMNERSCLNLRRN